MLVSIVVSRDLPGREGLPVALAAAGATVVYTSARVRGEAEILADEVPDGDWAPLLPAALARPATPTRWGRASPSCVACTAPGGISTSSRTSGQPWP